MKHYQLGFGLLGKGLFALAAIILMLGGEPDSRATQVQEASVPSQQRLLLDVRPAPLPTVRASAELHTGSGAPQSYVF